MDILCDIGLLGGLRVVSRRPDPLGDFRSYVRTRPARMDDILARLAYGIGERQSREMLADMLWPESPTGKALQSLNVELSRLRKTLKDLCIPPGAVLESDRASVWLNPATVAVDVAVFEERRRRALRAGDRRDRLRLLLDAIDGYAGSLLPRFDQEWVEPARVHLAGLHFEVAELAARLLEQDGDWDRAIDVAGRAVDAAAPDSEEAAALRMRLIEARPPARPPAPRIDPKFDPQPAPAAIVVLLLVTLQDAAAFAWSLGAEQAASVAAQADALIGREIDRFGGRRIPEHPDRLAAAFDRADAAVECAVACQRSLAAELRRRSDGGAPAVPAARTAVHAGHVEWMRDGALGGGDVVHEARALLDAGHGGQILVSAAAAALARTSLKTGVTLRGLGNYQLRADLPAFPIHQADYADMPRRDYPPPIALKVRQSDLPPYYDRFFGREDDVAGLADLVCSRSARLVTVTGTGGAGKTRLSVEVARAVSPKLFGAVWFVPMLALPDTGHIAEHLQRVVCGSAGFTDRHPLDDVVDILSAQPSLLVFDNFERLLPAGRDVVRRLLERVEDLTCLATSRQRLGLAAEREWPLRPLPTPDGAGTSPDEIGRFGSVQLFVDRARRRFSRFQLTEANAAAVAEICVRLDGLPLALELAASWAASYTPERMLQRLGDILVDLDGDRSEHHRSLRAAMDLSWDLLDPDLQRFFARMSVFRGGWTLEAAEAVGGAAPPALVGLERLRTASLVTAEPADAEGSEMRYGMLETLRTYAADRLREAGEDSGVAAGRHRDFYLRLAEDAAAGLSGWNQAVWLDRLEREHRNLRLALAAADPETHLQVVSRLRRFWETRGRQTEGRTLLRRALQADAAASPALTPATRRMGLLAAGSLALEVHECQPAHDLFLEGLGLCESDGDRASSRMLIAAALLLQDRKDEALAAAEEALRLAVACFGESDPEVGEYECTLGLVRKMSGDLAAARVHYDRALRLTEPEIDRWPERVAKYRSNLGALLEAAGEHREALALMWSALSIDRRVFGRRHPKVAIRHNNIGRVWGACRGDWRRALRHHRAALRIYEENYPVANVHTGMTHYYVARAYEALSRPGDALFAYRQALPPLERRYSPEHPRCKEVRAAIARLKKYQ